MAPNAKRVSGVEDAPTTLSTPSVRGQFERFSPGSSTSEEDDEEMGGQKSDAKKIYRRL